jgi:hypothetical protein
VNRLGSVWLTALVMAFWAPLDPLGTGAVAVNAASLSWVSPDVDAVQLADWAEALDVASWLTMGPRPKTAARDTTVQPMNRTRCSDRTRGLRFETWPSPLPKDSPRPHDDFDMPPLPFP